MIRSPRVLLPAVAVLIIAGAVVVAVRSGDDGSPIVAASRTTVTTLNKATTPAPTTIATTGGTGTTAAATATTRAGGAALTTTAGATTTAGPTTTRPATTGATVPVGTWGGKGIQLNVTATGGTVEYDCAAGVISTPLTLGPTGAFDATGTHRNSTGGPVGPSTPTPRALAARYTGAVTGSQMRLTVTLETGTTLGPYTLALGQAPLLDRCS